MKDLKIRKYKKEDFDSLAKLTKGNQEYIQSIDKWSMHDVGKNYGIIVAHKYLEDIQNNDGEVLLAEINGEIVGCGLCIVEDKSNLNMLKKKYQKVGLVKDMFVIEEYRRAGIASKIFNQLEKILIKRGCGSIRLEVFETNNNARRMYERLGYENHSTLMIKSFR